MIGALTAAALLASAGCAPLPGMEAVLARPSLQFLLFGEAHGTAEAPALFLDAVCAATAKGPVTVRWSSPRPTSRPWTPICARTAAPPPARR